MRLNKQEKQGAYILFALAILGIASGYGLTGFVKESFGIAPKAVYSPGMEVLSADYIEYDSNAPQFQNGFVKILARVGAGSESINAYQDTITPEDINAKNNDLYVKNQFTIKTETTRQACVYDINEKNNGDVFTYTSTQILCPTGVYLGCSKQDMDNYCTNQAGSGSLVVNNILTNKRITSWDKSICVFKTLVADLGDVISRPPIVNVKVKLDQYEAEVSNYGNIQVNLPETNPKAIVKMVGLTGLGDECPSPAEQKVDATKIQGLWVLSDADLQDDYVSARDLAEYRIQNYGSEREGLTISTVNNILSSVNSLQQQLFQPKIFKHSGRYEAMVSGSQAIINLPNNIYYTDLTMLLDADYIKVYKPVADLQMGTPNPKNLQFDENVGGRVTVPVTNVGEVDGEGYLTVACTGGFTPTQTSQKVVVPSGRTYYYDVGIDGSLGNGGCSICLQDDIDRTCEGVNVVATGFRECVDGEQQCLGKQPQKCENKKWVNKDICGNTQVCELTSSGAVCKDSSDVTCNTLCINNGYETGTCTAVSVEQYTLPFIFGKKNMGYGAGNCGLINPPENCLCTVKSKEYPYLLGMLSAITLFALGYYKLYPKEILRSVVLALIPLILLYLFPSVGIDAISYENQIVGSVENILPEPWIPSDTQVVIVSAIAFALIGITFSIANVIPGDELPVTVIAAIIGVIIGYAFKQIIQTLQLPLSVGLGIASYTYLKEIIIKKLNIKQNQAPILALLGSLAVIIVAYVTFWHAVIIMLVIGLLKLILVNKNKVQVVLKQIQK